MRCSCPVSCSLARLNSCTATPKASPRLATSTALPVTCAATACASATPASTVSREACADALQHLGGGAHQRVDRGALFGAGVVDRVEQASRACPVRRLRSSSTALSRTRLSVSSWRSSPITSAAARGASRRGLHQPLDLADGLAGVRPRPAR